MISCNKIDGALGSCSSLDPPRGEVVGVVDSELGIFTLTTSALPLRLDFGEPSLLMIESRGDFDGRCLGLQKKK